MANPLLDARVEKGLTQEQLAELAGVAASTIVRAEKGLPIWALSEAKIARALGIRRRDLFPDEVPA